MSILIGYWATDIGNQPSNDLPQLLNRAVVGLESSKLRVRSFSGCSPEQPSGQRVRTTSFDIAAYGRHTTLHAADAGSPSVEATLAAGGSGFEADVWAKVSRSGLILGRDIFGRATIFWTQTETAVWFSSRMEF